MTDEKNLYRSIETEVLEIISETPTIITTRLKLKEDLSFKPGQFIEMSIPVVGESR